MSLLLNLQVLQYSESLHGSFLHCVYKQWFTRIPIQFFSFTLPQYGSGIFLPCVCSSLFATVFKACSQSISYKSHIGRTISSSTFFSTFIFIFPTTPTPRLFQFFFYEKSLTRFVFNPPLKILNIFHQRYLNKPKYSVQSNLQLLLILT